MSLLEMKNVTKKFKGLVAVNDVSLHVEQGEIISIIGPNGAGKTTLFNMLTGVYQVTSGEIIFKGKPIQNNRPQTIVGAGIARTFQNIRLFKEMRVIENVLIGGSINIRYSFPDLVFKTARYRRAERESTQKAMDILESIGLADYADDYAQNLPYGLQRRLEIARAIATDTSVLLLDEPAAGMNPQESGDLLDFIKELRDQGYTILMIEHDMNVVMNISDRIYVLDYGKLIASGLPKEIAANPRVCLLYTSILKRSIEEMGIAVEDMGVSSEADQLPYALTAKAVCDRIIDSGYEKRGVLICGTGIGMCMTANKFKGIRAAVGHDIFSAQRSVLSNNGNVICFGARVIGPELAKTILREWLKLDYIDGPSTPKIKVITSLETANFR